jgi:glycosyltransferase involved in cell wall biosynthesis
MKKVLIFSLAYYPDHVGGAEVAIKEITDRIPDIDFHLITQRFTRNLAETERIGNVTVHRVGNGSSALSKALFLFRAGIAGARLNRTTPFDGAWAMMSYMTVPVVLMRLLGARIPYALTLQEGDTYEHTFKRPQVLPLLPFIDAGFRNASVVQTISSFLSPWARKRGFRGPIEMIQNGASVESGRAIPEDEKVAARQELRIETGHFVLITVSRLVHKNAVDDCIKALAMLPARFILLVVGGGEDEAALRELAETLGVMDRVRFTGQVDRSKTALYRSVSHIFIRPSRSEGMGNSFVSSMSAGLPVIATQEGGIIDFLFDPERNPDKEPTGLAVDKDSPDQIARAVQKLAADPELAVRIARNAKMMVEHSFRWDTIAESMKTRVFSRIIK